ncbi:MULTISPECIES: hypothetical protein [Enterococcus]|jgi:hypothetical protein|uniref:hypothetical protein n=1 Tax=Enterococcus TaxID=1350 RepID=UPI0010416582|nr:MULTISPECIES: hypothetical protein [Enterococcus]TXX29716.1 hypothetical protein D4M43_23660 [Escherichia coli]DAL85410.1 MAG TPA: hypothetical protein [Caudoviricetes sp.]MCI5684551.1 hypothetical protein [Enterococcus gallinarum]MCR1930886.1 hypothetical protein [Enterococcus gallinarum]MCR1932860.1 hypothetical protein [Enterococcus gallinarum]
MRKNDDKLIILQNAKFYWSIAVINQAKDLFEKGFKPSQVAEIMNEKVIDIGLVYLHLLETKQLRR